MGSTPPSLPPGDTQTEQLASTLLPYDLPLETLKALHAANFNRWEKRRNYEWLLSYAIWGGLAGFIATILLGKDSQFHASNPALLIAGLASVVIAHGLYLYFITDSTIRDLKAQKVFEEAMCKHLGDPEVLKKSLPTQHFRQKAPPADDVWWLWWVQSHGLFAQVLLTAILGVTAYWASTMRPQAPTTAVPSSTSPEGYVCNGCTQTFSAPPDAPTKQVRTPKAKAPKR